MSNFDIRLQLQTDPFLMPLENNAVLWPTRLSPRVSVATLRLPKQKFNSPAQIKFARILSYNPWHSVPRTSARSGIKAGRRGRDVFRAFETPATNEQSRAL